MYFPAILAFQLSLGSNISYRIHIVLLHLHMKQKIHLAPTSLCFVARYTVLPLDGSLDFAHMSTTPSSCYPHLPLLSDYYGLHASIRESYSFSVVLVTCQVHKTCEKRPSKGPLNLSITALVYDSLGPQQRVCSKVQRLDYIPRSMSWAPYGDGRCVM
ncbi:hypothetical protein CYLTODRAFT_146798 [Cylindrobasidium torrendii FP15055 ss-10]|uniref:Uncharacterized protein n=1 Tax=Cylindrobasidium torrendii FP15055 ss-10 TaxID=1314674 RepID=A0A0D7B108_9AGAR|nr:hypothetical protein CYLTODRAFT_146798 [Cylindrobasidium torrendii FP15055 ss-10]